MILRRLLLVAVSIVSVDLARAGEDPPRGGQTIAVERPAGPSATQAERRRAAAELIAQLGSPRFDVREEATKKLEQFGAEAVAPLLVAAGGESLEVTCRALRVLGTISASADIETFDAIEAGLEKLSASTNQSAARRALTLLGSHSHRRWKMAIVRIRDLGGIVRRMDLAAGQEKEILDALPEEYVLPTVILDDNWKGGGAGLVNLQRLAARGIPPTVYVTKGAAISPDAIAELQRAVPQIKIEPRGNAMLGVTFIADGDCLVRAVSPNSAAEKAGIREGDKIVKYDGEALTSSKRLVEITGDHKPGDKVVVEVLRGTEVVTLEAQLTGWAPGLPAGPKK